MNEIPIDFDCIINELYYKIGVRGMVFVWINGEWQRSALEPHKVREAIGEI